MTPELFADTAGVVALSVLVLIGLGCFIAWLIRNAGNP